MVLEAEFPPDERVEKETKSLIQAGYSVSIAVYTRKGLESKQIMDNYTIYRKVISPLLYKSSAAILLHPFYFRFWYRFLDSILSADKYDVIHMHDLPLAKVGYRLSVKHHLKLVCDQHEFYSNWIVRTRHYNTFPGKIIRALSAWKKYERRYLGKTDLVITVEDALKKIYIDQVGVSTKRIITLPNTPSFETFNAAQIDSSIIERYADRFVLFYAGGLDHLRGIDFILQSLFRLKKEIKNILFLVAGKESRAFNMMSMIREYQVEEVTDFVGWIPLKTLSSYIAASDVCLFVPKADNLEINNTIATKIYQYAAMGKPVVVSEAIKMKQFVESNKIGYSVHWGNVNELTAVIKGIYNDPLIAQSIKSKAVEIASRYTWEKTSIDFLQSYSQLI